MPTLELKPTHKPVQKYYAALRQFSALGVNREGAYTVEKVRTLCASPDDLRAGGADAAQRACSLA